MTLQSSAFRAMQFGLVAAFALAAQPALADDGNGRNARDLNTVEFLAGTNGAQALVGAVLYVEEAGVLDFSLVGFLSDPENSFILFAPNNPAFENLLALQPGSLQGLSAEAIRDALGGLVDAETVAGILLKHVVPVDRKNRRSAAETALLVAGSATAADGSALSVSIGGRGVQVDAATIIKANVLTQNSVVHFIDAVL